MGEGESESSNLVSFSFFALAFLDIFFNFEIFKIKLNLLFVHV